MGNKKANFTVTEPESFNSDSRRWLHHGDISYALSHVKNMLDHHCLPLNDCTVPSYHEKKKKQINFNRG